MSRGLQFLAAWGSTRAAPERVAAREAQQAEARRIEAESDYMPPVAREAGVTWVLTPQGLIMQGDDARRL